MWCRFWLESGERPLENYRARSEMTIWVRHRHKTPVSLHLPPIATTRPRYPVTLHRPWINFQPLIILHSRAVCRAEGQVHARNDVSIPLRDKAATLCSLASRLLWNGDCYCETVQINMQAYLRRVLVGSFVRLRVAVAPRLQCRLCRLCRLCRYAHPNHLSHRCPAWFPRVYNLDCVPG